MSMSDVEAERVLAVLERTEVKLELLGCVPLGRDEGLCLELAAMSCEETLDVLDRQWQLETAYAAAETMAQLRQKHRHPKHKPESVAAISREDQEIALAAATLALSVRLRADATARDVLARWREAGGLTVSATYRACQSALVRLREVTHEALQMTAETAKLRASKLQALAAREEQALLALAGLETELVAQRAKQKEQRAAVDARLATLTRALDGLKEEHAQEIARVAAETAAFEEAAAAAHASKQAAVAESIHRIEEETRKLQETDAKAQEGVRKRKRKAYTELSGAVEKYDKDIAARQAELDALRGRYTDERRRVVELTTYFRRIDADAARAAEEEKIIAERREREAKAEFAINHIAARRIQLGFKGFTARAAAARKEAAREARKAKKKK